MPRNESVLPWNKPWLKKKNLMLVPLEPGSPERQLDFLQERRKRRNAEKPYSPTFLKSRVLILPLGSLVKSRNRFLKAGSCCRMQLLSFSMTSSLVMLLVTAAWLSAGLALKSKQTHRCSSTLSRSQRPPTFFGTRDQFCGRQIFPWNGGGMIWGWFKLTAFIVHFTSIVITSAPPWITRHGPGGWGPLLQTSPAYGSTQDNTGVFHPLSTNEQTDAEVKGVTRGLLKTPMARSFRARPPALCHCAR